MGCEGCTFYVTDKVLKALNELYGEELYPLNVEWKNCLQGEDYWLNCKRRKG
ncbi:MAG: hypothetical protein QXR81_07610 [Candidatus Nezhaarchaeales archaeon]